MTLLGGKGRTRERMPAGSRGVVGSQVRYPGWGLGLDSTPTRGTFVTGAGRGERVLE